MPSYKVVGTAPILDHQPGETITDPDAPQEQIDFLIAIGGLAVVSEAPAPEPVEPPEVAPAKVPAPKVITRDADGH